MSDNFRLQVFIIKHATYLSMELKEKAKRIELEGDGILPASKFVMSKSDLSRDSFIYKHSGRSLVLSLYTGLIAANHDDDMKDAIDELATTTFQLTDYMVPLKATPVVNGVKPDFMEAYLVRESCIIKCKRKDCANFTLNDDRDSKYKILMESVVEMIGCLQTLNMILLEKERELRVKRFMEILYKTQKELTLTQNGEQEEEEEYDSDGADLFAMRKQEPSSNELCKMEAADKEKKKKQEEQEEAKLVL